MNQNRNSIVKFYKADKQAQQVPEAAKTKTNLQKLSHCHQNRCNRAPFRHAQNQQKVIKKLSSPEKSTYKKGRFNMLPLR